MSQVIITDTTGRLRAHLVVDADDIFEYLKVLFNEGSYQDLRALQVAATSSFSQEDLDVIGARLGLHVAVQMPATITDRDMTYFVQEALMQDAPDFNVAGIVDELKGRFGLVDLDAVPSADFWAAVERNAIPGPEAADDLAELAPAEYCFEKD